MRNKEHDHEYHKAYYLAHKDKDREKYKAKSRIYSANLRAKVITLLGGKCADCGMDNPRALEIHHVNGGGNKERQVYKGQAMYRHILTDGSTGYMLLCATCHRLRSK